MPSVTFNRTISQVAVAQGGAGSTDLVAAAPGLKIYVVGYVLTMSAAGTYKFQENAATDLTGAMDIALAGGEVVFGQGDQVILATLTAGVKLNLVSTVGLAKGWLRYFLDT